MDALDDKLVGRASDGIDISSAYWRLSTLSL